MLSSPAQGCIYLSQSAHQELGLFSRGPTNSSTAKNLCHFLCCLLPEELIVSGSTSTGPKHFESRNAFHVISQVWSSDEFIYWPLMMNKARLPAILKEGQVYRCEPCHLRQLITICCISIHLTELSPPLRPSPVDYPELVAAVTPKLHISVSFYQSPYLQSEQHSHKIDCIQAIL